MSFWNQELDNPRALAVAGTSLRRLIGRHGGVIALAVDGLFWLVVWIWNGMPALPLGLLAASLYVAYVSLPLSVPLIGVLARKNITRGEQSQKSAILQMVLASFASGFAWWTIARGYVELP